MSKLSPRLLTALFLAVSLAAAPTHAQRGKRVNVKDLKKEYWSKGSDDGVVQNRTYVKKNHVHVGLLAGLTTSDPFISITQFGGSLGFSFSEFFGIAGLYWVNSVSASTALDELRNAGENANTNEPKDYKGGELVFSLIYGKLSLLGTAIIHYDLHAVAGGGITATESGNNFTIHAGIGQIFYVSKIFSLLVDYRLMRYNELIVEKNNPVTLGQVQSERTTYASSFMIGLGIML